MSAYSFFSMKIFCPNEPGFYCASCNVTLCTNVTLSKETLFTIDPWAQLPKKKLPQIDCDT